MPFTPLITIYAGPVQLLGKVRRDGEALKFALGLYDDEGMRDTLFNFAVTAYHVVDWIKAHRPDLADPVNALLNGDDRIGACRDLCNASKHVEIDLERKVNQLYPPVVEDVTISSITAPPEVPNGWRLKIKLKSGRILRAEEWAAQVVEIWEAFFVKHRIS